MRPTKSLLDSLGITEKEYWADKPYGDTPPGVVTPGRIKAAKEGFKFINPGTDSKPISNQIDQGNTGNKINTSVIDKRMATQQPSDYIYGQKGPSHYDSVDRELWRNQPAFEALRAAGGYRYPKQDFGPGGNNQWGTGWGSPSGTGGGNTG